MHRLIPFFVLLCLLVSGCKRTPITKNNNSTGELIFQSGFENSTVIPRNADADIIGADNSFSDHNDWVKDFDNHPDIGSFNLQYHKGDSSMRYARIIEEPGNSSNHVLQFWLNEPSNEQSNGRIQANLYGNKGLKEFYQSVRMFLPEDFNTVPSFPKNIHWLTIAEFWNNITWSPTVPDRFRITLGLGKPTEKEDGLFFIVDAQDCELFENGRQKYTTIWAETNEKIKVPVGKWFTMEYYYKEGDSTHGRFYMAITPQNGNKTVVFDVTRITHNTQDHKPDGVTDFNPMKLYTSKELVQYMKSKGKTLQIYWDDFKLWKNKLPG